MNSDSMWLFYPLFIAILAEIAVMFIRNKYFLKALDIFQKKYPGVLKNLEQQKVPWFYHGGGLYSSRQATNLLQSILDNKNLPSNELLGGLYNRIRFLHKLNWILILIMIIIVIFLFISIYLL